MLNHFNNFWSNNFELILYTNVSFVVSIIGVIVVVKLSEIRRKSWVELIQRILFFTLVVSQTVWMCLFIYIYWFNYERESNKTLTEKLVVNTDWVRENLTLYYVASEEDKTQLNSVKINGKDHQKLVKAEDAIKEYHLSPNGRYVLVVTSRQLILYDQKTKKTKEIDHARVPKGQKDAKSIIRNISWAPDSKRVCYEKSRWSKFSSDSKYYLYNIEKMERKPIENSLRIIPKIYWSRDAESLYYYKEVAVNDPKSDYPFEVKIFQTSVNDLKPEFVEIIISETKEPSEFKLSLYGIELYYEGHEFSFGRDEKRKYIWVSNSGSKVGVDENDYMYYVQNQWWRKRLFKVTREEPEADIPYYPHQGGVLQIKHLDWSPSSRYVIMSHSVWGILVLEPKTGKIGQLIDTPGYTFGWYQDPS